MVKGFILFFLIMLGISLLLAWLFKKNAKLAIGILMGLLSLIVSIALAPQLEILTHIKDMTSIPLSLKFSYALIISSISIIIVTFLCVASIIKICKSDTGGNFKFVGATFTISVLVAAFTFITLILSSLMEGAFGKSIAEIMFTRNYRYEENRLYLAIVCSCLLFIFSIVGLIILKNEKKVNPNEPVKEISNRFFLLVTSILLLIFSFFTTFCSLSVTLILIGKLTFLISSVVSLCSFSIFIALIIGINNPDKLHRFLKIAFSMMVLLSALPTFNFLFIFRENLIMFISLIVLGLSALGFFLVKMSRIVFEKEKKPKTFKFPKINSKSSEDIAKGAEILKQKTTVYSDLTVTTYQGIFKKAKQILISPQTEYLAIEQEDAPHEKILKSYVLPLLVIPALFSFIGYGLVGYSMQGHHFNDIGWGFRMAIVQIIVLLGGLYLSTFIISMLSDTFGAMKNFNRTFSLLAYAFTPMFIAGIFHIHHSLWWLVFLVGLYGLYLLFVGLKPILKPAKDKADTFTIISLMIPVVSYIILFLILKGIVLPQGFYFM